MAKKDGVGRQVSANNPEAALRSRKGQQGVLKDQMDPGKQSANPYREHQDGHGTGEGETGMQPGAGHPRGR